MGNPVFPQGEKEKLLVAKMTAEEQLMYHILHFIHTYGLTLMIKGLIAAVESNNDNEKYTINLLEDLKHLLKRYEDRYEE